MTTCSCKAMRAFVWAYDVLFIVYAGAFTGDDALSDIDSYTINIPSKPISLEHFITSQQTIHITILKQASLCCVPYLLNCIYKLNLA